MKKCIFFILLGVIALSSCKKVVEVKDLDKEINLYFSYDFTGSYLTTFDNDYTTSMLKDFDKRDYKHIDSITFNIALLTERTNDTAFVRLYNITDHVEIANSLIVAPSLAPTRYVEFHSKNILADLPDKRIDLGIQIRSSSPGRAASGANPRLKLRRN
jgi:hypothetical protein